MKPNPAASVIEDKELPDISAIDLQKRLLVDNPVDREGYLRLRSYTPARIGIGHEGPRYKLASALRFRADHAAAQDSVFSDVPEDFIQKMGMIPVETICTSKDDYLTNPPKGSQFSDEEMAKIKAAVPDHPKVEIVVGDGLSSAAITANIADILPAIRQGLQVYGLDFGNVIFVKHARVRAEDAIGEATGADVVVMLIGERPGLVTAESMSAYVAYKPTVGMPEARRTVISNIHSGGTPAVEAGAHIAELVKNMLDYKASGIALKQAQGEPLDWDGTEA